MPAPLSRSAHAIERSGIRDVFDRAARIPDVISLALGEPTETAAAHIVAAAEQATRDGLTHYTDILGIPEFRQAASTYTQRVKGLHYSAATETQVIPGATLGLYLTFRAILDPGDEVIVPSPAFTSYDAQVTLAGGRPIHVPLRPENGMRLDADDIAAAITPRTRAIIINNPSNPTGAVTPAAELERIGALCETHNLWAISDEVYHPFVYTNDRPAPSIAAAIGMRERTVIVESLSKTFAMTGWRIGYLHGPASLIEQTAAIAELIHSSINAPAQYAAVAALTGPLDGVVAQRERYRDQRDLVLAELGGSDAVRPLTPDGAFYAFVDIRRTGLTSDDFAQTLLDEWHVAVVPGTAFGAAGEGFVRVSYAGDTAQLREGLRRLRIFAEHRDESADMRSIGDASIGEGSGDSLGGDLAPREPARR